MTDQERYQKLAAIEASLEALEKMAEGVVAGYDPVGIIFNIRKENTDHQMQGPTNLFAAAMASAMGQMPQQQQNQSCGIELSEEAFLRTAAVVYEDLLEQKAMLMPIELPRNIDNPFT